MEIAMLGAGAWGLALANLLARRGNRVRVWDRSGEAIGELRAHRTRNRLAGLVLEPGIRYESNLVEAVSGAKFVVNAVPSYGMRQVCRALREQGGLPERAVFVNCSKGIESETLAFPSRIFEEELGGATGWPFAALTGPSHAEEVARDVPTVVVSASREEAVARRVRDLFHSTRFRVYAQMDLAGAELGGALKNVIAIAAGACDGLGFGDNTRAALVTRGVAEMARATVALGGKDSTSAGLSGVGDLIVTAMSRHSRNRRFGELIAVGLDAESALGQVGAAVEGYPTARAAWRLATEHGVEMPIVGAVYRVLYEGVGVEEAILSLLERDPGAEF